MELLFIVTGLLIAFFLMIAAVIVIINASLSRHREAFEPVHAASGCPLSFANRGTVE